MQTTQMRKILVTRFNESELRDLCFDLGIDYENLKGSGKGDKARELVAYCERHNRSAELAEVVQRLRPGIFSPRARVRVFLRRPSLETAAQIADILAVIVAVISLLVAVAVWMWPTSPFVQSNPSGCKLAITELSAAKANLRPNETTNMTVIVQGCGTTLTYVWTADNGRIEPSGLTAHSTITYTAPTFIGTDVIRVLVSDKVDRTVSGETKVNVVQGSGNP